MDQVLYYGESLTGGGSSSFSTTFKQTTKKREAKDFHARQVRFLVWRLSKIGPVSRARPPIGLLNLAPGVPVRRNSSRGGRARSLFGLGKCAMQKCGALRA
jgi:hypothetical protein